jgi:cold shock CspA family protein
MAQHSSGRRKKISRPRICFAGNSALRQARAISPHNASIAADIDRLTANKESAMQGQITKYRDDLGFGVIEADNGRRYRFAKHQIKNSTEMLIGQDVDFVLSASSPTDIIMLSGSPWAVFGGLSGRE